VTNPSLVLLRIRNAGIVDIRDDDFTSRLEFSFRDRQIRGSDVIECDGENEYRVLPLENRNVAVGCDRIKLAEFSMNRGDRITLLVLLSGLAQGSGSRAICTGGRSYGSRPAAVGQISRACHHTCPGAAISVVADGTFNGLNDLAGAGAQQPQTTPSCAGSTGGPSRTGASSAGPTCPSASSAVTPNQAPAGRSTRRSLAGPSWGSRPTTAGARTRTRAHR
jgi:hypothetical protein